LCFLDSLKTGGGSEIDNKKTRGKKMRRRRVTVDVTKAGRRLLDAITSHDVQKVRRVLATVPDSQRKDVVNSCVWLPEAAGVCGPMPIACVLAGQPSEPKVRAKMFDALLRNGLDVNARTNGHETCVSLCCSHGDVDLESVQLLLRCEADPNLMCGDGHWNALFRVCAGLPKSLGTLRVLMTDATNKLRVNVLGGSHKVPPVRYVLDFHCDQHPDKVVEALELLQDAGMSTPAGIAAFYTRKMLDQRYGAKKQHARIAELLMS